LWCPLRALDNKLFYSFLISPLSEGICQPSHTSGFPVPGAADGLLSAAWYCYFNITLVQKRF
jgi:hypothetical protein